VALSTEDKTVLDSLDTKLTTLAGYVDGLEALVTATNTKLDTLHADLAAATPAGTNLIGRAVADASAATGGIASTALLDSSAATTNALRVKNGAGRVYAVQGRNTAAYDVFLVLYDSTTSPPVPGTTAIRKKIPLPAGSAFALDWPLGLTFATGIGYAFTKLTATADTTAIAAGDIISFNLDYV
jgi:hypothetical protein